MKIPVIAIAALAAVFFCPSVVRADSITYDLATAVSGLAGSSEYVVLTFVVPTNFSDNEEIAFLLPGGTLPLGVEGSFLTLTNESPDQWVAMTFAPAHTVDSGVDGADAASVEALVNAETPEPGTFLLLGTGLLPVVPFIRKRNPLV